MESSCPRTLSGATGLAVFLSFFQDLVSGATRVASLRFAHYKSLVGLNRGTLLPSPLSDYQLLRAGNLRALALPVGLSDLRFRRCAAETTLRKGHLSPARRRTGTHSSLGSDVQSTLRLHDIRHQRLAPRPPGHNAHFSATSGVLVRVHIAATLVRSSLTLTGRYRVRNSFLSI